MVFSLSNTLRSALVASILLLPIACQEDRSASEALAEITPDPDRTLALGHAYDSRIDRAFSYSCAGGNIKTQSATDAEFTYRHDLEQDELARELGLDIGISFGVGSLNLTPGISFATANAARELSSTQTLIVRVNGRSQSLDLNTLQLTSQGEELVRDHGDRIEQWCGNELITKVDYGASLIASVRYDFASESDKKLIGGKLGIGAGVGGLFDLIGLRLGMKSINERARERTTVEISAIQTGGEPTALASVLPERSARCSLSDIERCLAAFDDILAYARSDFQNQLREDSGWVATRYVSTPYRETGLALQALHESAAPYSTRAGVILKVRDLKTKRSEEIANMQKASSLLRESNLFQDVHREELSNIEQLSKENADAADEALRICQLQTAESCLAVQPVFQNYDVRPLAKTYGRFGEALARGEMVALRIDYLPELGPGDERTRITLVRDRPGRTHGSQSEPAALVEGSLYLIQTVRRSSCLFPKQSLNLKNGCADERHLGQNVGFMVFGDNASYTSPSTGTFFNANLQQNQISLWGFVFSFDPSSGEVFSADGEKIGNLSLVDEQTRFEELF